MYYYLKNVLRWFAFIKEYLGRGGSVKSRENPGIAKIGLTPPPPSLPNLGTLVDFTTKSA